MNHGTRHAYVNLGCRCADCKAAQNTYMRDLRKRLRQREPEIHGDNGYRNYKCRCETCRAAYAKSQRQYRKNRKTRET